MKRIITMALIALPLAFSARAQWIVYDPTVNIEQIISEAENIAQFVSMVDNQVQQIQQLTSQLEQLQQYNRAFGDPSQILNVTGVSALRLLPEFLPLNESTELGRSLPRRVASATAS